MSLKIWETQECCNVHGTVEELQTDGYVTEENDKVPEISIEEARMEILLILQKIREGENCFRFKENFLDPERLEKLKNITKSLRIKVQNSNVIPKGTIIDITPLGLTFTKRKTQDGVVYFANKRKTFPKRDVTADFVIPTITVPETREPHFLIYFSLDTEKFVLRDLGVGNGTFIKVEETYSIADNSLINIGDSYILMMILKKNTKDSLPTLCMKIYSGTRIGEVMYFYAQECYVKEVYIGRGKDCQVQIDDTMISNHQATVFFSSQKGWMLVDGDLSTQRPSTNGTWICACQDYEFTGTIDFKACSTLFRATIIN